MAGGQGIGVCSTENVDRVRAFGAAEVVDYTKKKLADALAAVDIVLDFVGGDIQGEALKVLAKGGTLISSVQPPADGLMRSLGITGKAFYMQPSAKQLSEIADLFDRSALKIYIAKVLPLDKAAEAEELNRQHRVHGKIVLTL
jgi:NADPH:quinone reductase-like Zn-dependent oxidoreductase